MMGIDRIHTMLSQFGYGKSTGIDLNEEYSGLLPSREWKQKVHKKAWYQGDTVSVGIGQGYWIATPIQMVKAMVALINNGRVIAPICWRKPSAARWWRTIIRSSMKRRLAILIHLTGRWYATRCLAWLTHPTAPGINISTRHPMASLRKAGRRRCSACARTRLITRR